MPADDPTRPEPRPSPIFLLDHGSIGYQTGRSTIDPGWVEVVIEDDEVELTLVSTPAKLFALGLSIASMLSLDALGLARIEALEDQVRRLSGGEDPGL